MPKRHFLKELNPLGGSSFTWVGKIPWRRAGQHSPVFLPGESHGQGYGPWGSKESDRTEVTY